MAKTWVILGAAMAISAAAFTHSAPASAHEWVAPAASHCYTAYYGGGGCCNNSARGLFTSGVFGGCGCAVWHNPAYSYPGYRSGYYMHPYVGPYHRHYYRPYVRHSLYRYGLYHRYGAYHGHRVYRGHHDNAHMRHW